MKPLILIACSAVLAACSTNSKELTSLTDSDFEIAVPAPADPKPFEIVELVKPLPLPGQLKPVEGSKIKKHDLPPLAAVEKGMKTATVEPTVDGHVNSMQVYPFTEGALYRIYTAPQQISDIALQPGEQLISVSAGDTVRWVVGDTTSGQGKLTRAHVLIKPIAADLITNVMISTDRRTYHLEAESTDSTYMAAVSWHYPADDLRALQRRNVQAEADEARIIDRGLDISKLRFAYRLEGDTPSWRPLRVFDDGRKVYIQMPADLSVRQAPPLFVIGRKGDSRLVNYRVKGRYYIVDRLFDAAELRLGEEPQEVVRIFRAGAGFAAADMGHRRRMRVGREER